MMIHVPLFLESIGTGELLVIILVVFLFFGPEKMPEIARKLGKVMNDMKKASSDITQEFTKHTQPIRDEFLSASNEIKKQTDGFKEELNNTYGNPFDQPVTEATPEAENQQETITTKPSPSPANNEKTKQDLAG